MSCVRVPRVHEYVFRLVCPAQSARVGVTCQHKVASRTRQTLVCRTRARERESTDRRGATSAATCGFSFTCGRGAAATLGGPAVGRSGRAAGGVQRPARSREGYPGWVGPLLASPPPLTAGENKRKHRRERCDSQSPCLLVFFLFRGGEERGAPCLYFLLIWEGVRGRRRTQASRQSLALPPKRTANRHGARTTPSPPLSAARAHRARACTSARARQLPGPTP